MHRVGWAGGCGCSLCWATSAEFFPLQCKLTGKWKNDLGSNMTISEINGDGDFNGTYFTATSASPGPIKESPLVGSQQLPYASQPTFGFTVHWSFSNTITVFMGQCFVDKHGKEVLKTMWLLRLHSDKLANNWNATLAGYDTFWRLEELKD
ncbi:avidin-related protein 7-like isoform X1 [Passer domesticus]|uniref:avidin-related protein 7-like isoform X1 n=1 Tax=Passer domesticus TaxID=48849 RepID=UPI0030FEA116